MTDPAISPLPVTKAECLKRGWDEIDIVLVSGDAYIDHPSFGIALIGRLLESHGFRVAILAQPRFDNEEDFRRFGRPRLFFGISGGNLDSIVANYSGNGKVRDFDAYSPGGNPWRSSLKSKENRFRPDRAALLYSNLARRAYPGVTIILGGVEASLRRFVHFDYKQNRLRGSHLTDSKADLLIYGMGEKAVVNAARRLGQEESLENLAGSCIRVGNDDIQQFRNRLTKDRAHFIELPSWQEIQDDITLFLAAEKSIDTQARAGTQTILIQKQQAAWLVQYPANQPLTPPEMDRLHEMPFSRTPHPATDDIPAFTMIRDSITIVRGCSGNCSFCAISRHQGPSTTSRSVHSVIREAQTIASGSDFKGTISDLGGPTANLFATSCAIGSCRKHDCLYPEICDNLVIEEERFLELLDKMLQVNGVRHAYISSGLRLGLLLRTPKLLEKIIKDHLPGAMKVAPEHTESDILTLMHKEPHKQFVAFLEQFRAISHRLGKKSEITPYIISAHPGCTEAHNQKMVQRLQDLGVIVRQFQDFTPTPGTLSTAMYVSRVHRDTGKSVTTTSDQSGRIKQRKVIEQAFFSKKNKPCSLKAATNRKHAALKKSKKIRNNSGSDRSSS